jgi:hypothetical protein
MTNAPAVPVSVAASQTHRHQVGRAALWSVVTIVAALVGAYIALATLSSTGDNADIVRRAVSMTAFALVVPVHLAARSSFYVVPAVVLAAAWPQFYVAKAMLEQALASGSSGGLESLHEVQAGFMAAAFVVAALLGARNGTTSRS